MNPPAASDQAGASPAQTRGGAETHGTLRRYISQGFSRIEDIVYVGLGSLLAGSALVLLVDGVLQFGQGLLAGTLAHDIVVLLDSILLIMMIVEILYTVQVSFRDHLLAAEPFLIVGLIAAIRRVLVLTAEFSELLKMGETAFRNAMAELGILTLMILALVISLFLLRKQHTAHAITRS